ncbi:hypothetical protein A2954_02715 [Candidatus Roizmanbacteria bacterium RIFCSPLOWO2_01_FULL_37_12]|uniref:Core-binding (CB) domain-containing protein n=1 Tax=Candidatus Roizmanbacteria bacterium RIFCSPLOWO2_01_FULL_37_12 TaxID=1802056 RepID=A0A1F7IF04_9BACT|nr:MAG: hypothetical protein A2767_02240 [Candidatus Roizmanbacteria bacterium RIFCSPHIGHO2_01_FULL_35_10]OGK41937.1 MAG: hypothetical protein A2954_02715 [Candidatus Roizmanbacteria bacterium RIFCSPLOWO2_01_FULL_37_12]
MYNLSNLEPGFKNFLLAENISSVTLRNYMSDFRHFRGWLLSREDVNGSSNMNTNLNLLDSKIIEEYKNHHVESALPSKTINRRLSTLRKFFLFCQKEHLIADNPAKNVGNISIVGKINSSNKLKSPPELQVKAISAIQEAEKPHLEINKPYFLIPFKYLFLFIMTVISVVFSVLFVQKDKAVNKPVIFSSKDANRFLAFSGRLLDDIGNPLTSKTDVIFKFYSTPTDGKALYSSSCVGEKGAITPEVDGQVKILLGSECDGKPIPAKIFTDNPNLYLGITVGADAEMLPRQNIPNVGYAENTNTIQGLNIGNENMTVPYINQDGNLLIASNNSGIKSTYESSNFSISSAETVTLESAQAGDVILQATESGTIKLRTGGFTDSYTRLTINNEGNIGIGTLFPTYGFEVDDDVKITNGNRLILASASSDPSGENGAMYYNMQSNRFRCFQGGDWTDCFGKSENNSIGGVYAGNLTNDLTYSNLETQIIELKREIEKLNNDLKNITTAASQNVDSLLTTSYQLLTTNLSVRDKISSPVIETTRIETKEIKSKDGNLTVDLSNNSQASIPEVNPNQHENTSGVNFENKGPLASLIIKGLEGKTAASIDGAGNASFSGQLRAENILINKDASIAGNLKASNIESGNIAQLADKLNALEETTKINSSGVNGDNENTSEVKSEINNIQKLLAEIKNEKLSNPQYYQSLNSNQQWNNEIMEQLTVRGKSNFYDLSVTNSGAIGNLLIQDNSILSLAWDLKLSALSTIKLFDDAVIISKDGNIRTVGRVIANAGISTNKIEALNEGDPVRIDNLALHNLIINDKYLESSASGSIIASAENFEKNGLSIPAIETQTAIAGTGIIPANSQEIIIYNSKITDTSLVYLTPTTEIPTSQLSISKKESCTNTLKVNDVHENTSGVEEQNCKPYFKVSIGTPTNNTFSFNWLIIN